MDYNVYKKGGQVARALPGSQLEIDLLAYGFTLQGTSTNPDPNDKAVPSLSQKAIKTKTSSRKTQLLEIDKEVTEGYGTPATPPTP